jgi:GTPase SAR1 family protein
MTGQHKNESSKLKFRFIIWETFGQTEYKAFIPHSRTSGKYIQISQYSVESACGLSSFNFLQKIDIFKKNQQNH